MFANLQSYYCKHIGECMYEKRGRPGTEPLGSRLEGIEGMEKFH